METNVRFRAVVAAYTAMLIPMAASAQLANQFGACLVNEPNREYGGGGQMPLTITSSPPVGSASSLSGMTLFINGRPLTGVPATIVETHTDTSLKPPKSTT